MKTVLVLLFLSVTWSYQEIADRNKHFASAIYKELSDVYDSNFLVSPVLAKIILGLVQSGAKDETAQELRSSLYLPDDDGQIKELFTNLWSSLKSDNVVLTTANRVYLKKNLSITEQFQNLATTVYQARIENIDFADSDEAAFAINTWVKNQTANRIDNLIDKKLLSAETVAVLINALYLKAGWLRSFDNSSIVRQKFYKRYDDAIQVNYLREDGETYDYYLSYDLNAQFLRIPFLGKNAAIVFILPEKENVTGLEAQIDKVLGFSNFTQQAVNILIPKFKFETLVDFKPVLQKLGVNRAFSNQADFSGIAGEKGDLFIDQVLQKTFINLNEDGIEAGAATLAGIKNGSAAVNSAEFIADHPFLFYIQLNDVVVFLGRVLEPQL